jgi:hypothetical protein
MDSALLRHLVSFQNKFNKQFAAKFPLYKFHRLYEDRASLSEEERESLIYVETEGKNGFHVVNPFLRSLLRDHAIWFAPSTQFNDPWDAGGAVSILKNNSTIEEPILKLLFGEEQFAEVVHLPDQDRYQQIEDKLRDVFSLLRFACFTKRYNSNPMWAHYADNHRGVCLQFRFLRPPPKDIGAEYLIDPEFTGYYAVRYKEDFTRVPDLNDIGSAIEVMHTKHPDWAYEHEVRFIKMGDPQYPGVGGIVRFYKASLTAVIMGCKVPRALWRVVDVMLGHYGYEQTELVTAQFDYRTQSLKYLKVARKKEAGSN